MNVLRKAGLIGVGIVLAVVLLLGASVTFAQGPMDGLGGLGVMMSGSMVGGEHTLTGGHHDLVGSMVGGEHSDVGGHHEMMGTMGHDYTGMTAGDHQMNLFDHGDMASMHARMHDGEAIPAECEAMMNDPAMIEQMMEMMPRQSELWRSDEPFSLAEHQEWMNEQNIPADVQAQCLAHMAEHHPEGETQ